MTQQEFDNLKRGDTIYEPRIAAPFYAEQTVNATYGREWIMRHGGDVHRDDAFLTIAGALRREAEFANDTIATYEELISSEKDRLAAIESALGVAE